MKIRGGNNMGAALDRVADAALEVRVGFLSGATYPDGTSVPLVAAINEFGAPSRGQPPRPFMRRAVAKHQGHWAKDMATLLVKNDYNVEKTLDGMGILIEGQIRQSITDLRSPKLADSTKARKGSSKPLIETGHMRESVDHEVGPPE